MSEDREAWLRARARFDELVELEPDQRLARLEALGRTDPALRERVERLLRADQRAEAVMQDYSFGSPPPPVSPASTGTGDPFGIIGTTVSHFRVSSYLAAGGMGVVYAADDLLLRRRVALKFPLPHQQLKRSAKERFSNEAQSVARLDHSNLCTIYEVGECEHGVFLAMPLYPGETLKERLAREGRLPAATALHIVQQVVRGLAAAHAADIVHRDLKPGNVMLLPDGTAKILDFGLAKIRDVDLTRSQQTLGTIGYVAPEQLRGEPADARTDLWAVGVMLHEMLTGTLPFHGDHELSVLHAVLHEQPQPPSAVHGDVNAGFDGVVHALLQKNRADRYPSADALLADLGALERGASPALTAAARRRRPRVRAPLLTAVALVVIAAGVGWGLIGRGQAGAVGAADAEGLTWIEGTAEVNSAEQLAAALDPSNAGRRVRLAPGVYDIDAPLTVPDRMTVEGAGVMRFDTDGMPTGFPDDSRSMLRMAANVGGDVLTLGHGAIVRNLEIADLPGRSGNVVAVVSRRPGDTVSAMITDMVLVNPNPLIIGTGGPLGRGLLVTTLNPNLGLDPPAHEGAVVAVRMTRSIIRSPAGGGGWFAYNFAARSRISVDISGSVIGGGSEANGGVSRPDAVHDSEVRIESRGNLYRNEWADPCLSPLRGWNLTGGSGAPIPIALPATTRNRLVVRSVDDRLEGFTLAVLATGSRRFFAEPLNAPPTDNHIELQLIGTVITTPSCTTIGRGEAAVRPARGVPPTVDFRLHGAWVDNDALYPGDRNTVRAELRGVTGSGRRSNDYAHAAGSAGPLAPAAQGDGNRLELVGDRFDFARSNRAIDPAPGAHFFGGTRSGRGPAGPP